MTFSSRDLLDCDIV